MPIDPLTRGMAIKIVNKYVGTPDGELSGFSYRTLKDFYPEFCDLEVDVDRFGGTKRERFLEILIQAPPKDQAKILRGMLRRCPIGEGCAPETRTEGLAEEIRAEIRRLESVSPVDAGSLTFTVEVVERAIREARILIEEADATSAVDRVHTAIHGFVKGICAKEAIPLPKDASLTQAFTALRNQHPALRFTGPHPGEMRNILQGMATILDAMNTIRNSGSMAHPNDRLIVASEAMLIVNLTHSILHYLDSKLPRNG